MHATIATSFGLAYTMRMFAYMPPSWNGLLLIADVRQESDTLLDERNGGRHVLHYSFLRKYIGRLEWNRTARIAMFEHGTDMDVSGARDKKAARQRNSDRRTAARSNALAWIAAQKPKLIAVVQTRSASARKGKLSAAEGAIEGQDGTLAWGMLNPPGPLYECAGTIFQSQFGPVMGVLNPVNYEYVYAALIERWLNRAVRFASGMERVRTPRYQYTMPDAQMVMALDELNEAGRLGTPIALDIETFSDRGLITAIGLSDSQTAVSVPWDEFKPHGCTHIEPGASAAIKARATHLLWSSLVTKIVHNGIGFDIPLLRERGYEVNGPIRDTMIMHGLVYPQFRHGLQHAASSALCASPWKTAHLSGKRKDDPNVWIQNPHELRTYNCLDAYYTQALDHHLTKRILIKEHR